MRMSEGKNMLPRCGLNLSLFIGTALFVLLPVLPVTGSLEAQYPEASKLPLEELIYPQTSLCLLDIRGEELSYPFKLADFQRDILAFLRSADYMTVRTETEMRDVLLRNRLEAPQAYDSELLARIARLAGCDYIVSQRIVMCGQDRMDGFSIPVLFHRNKVTHWVELDMALVKASNGALQYSQRVRGEAAAGRGIQIYPVTEEPGLYLSFSEKEELSRRTMRNLARSAFEAIMQGIHKPLGDRFICYWRDEVHVIADKPGLCPICGSRLVKIKR